MIDKLYVENITVFEKLEMEFSTGINIFIGKNGTGKTTLLKIMYATMENVKNKKLKPHNILKYFNYGEKQFESIQKYENKDKKSVFIVENEKWKHEYSILNGIYGFNVASDAHKFVNRCIFIPSTEMLSHSKGLLAMTQKYEMPFDSTQIDIVVNAELPETKEVTEANKKLMSKVSKIIDGKVVYENGLFYVEKNNGMKVEFNLEAEGLRKFALLWKLIRNGLLESGTILFWDEPEANINPELIPVLVDILLELENLGIQIFIATHNYNLAKYFEIKRKNIENVMFYNLFISEKNIEVEKNEYFGKMKKNAIIEE